MTDDVTRRPWWRWMPGMRWRLSATCDPGGHDLGRTAGRVDEMWRAVDDTGRVLMSHDNIVPDPTDPATLGCLLARARELCGGPVVARVVGLFPTGKMEWAACDMPGRESMYGYPSEYAALIAACDAAPEGGR